MQKALKEDIRSGFAIFPSTIFDLHVASPPDAGNEDHGRRCDLIQVDRIMSGAADHGMNGIPELLGCFPNPFYESLIKSRMPYTPGLFAPYRTTSPLGDSPEIFLQVFPCPDG